MQCDQPPSANGPVAACRKLAQAGRKKAGDLLARLLYRKPAFHALGKELVSAKAGIEIGGPSHIFSGLGQFPLYDFVGSLDNCNFAEDSLWGKNSPHDGSYKFSSKKPAGQQKILEAIDLLGIPSASYDFLLSSHTIEHIANPVKALIEWKRLLKPGGTMLLVIPHKDSTFDHRRPVTPFAHLLQDYRMNTGEDDLTHLGEIMQLHDFTRDKGALSQPHFYQRALDNLHNRGLHHHVFDTLLAARLMDHVGLEIMQIEPLRPMHIILIARIPGTGQTADNSRLFLQLQSVLRSSPFPSDRKSQLA